MSKRRGAAPKEQQRRSGHRRLPIFFSSFLEGILQATRLDVAIAAVSRSETARAAALQCLGFNGLLLVSLVAWRWVVAPAAAAATTAAQGHTPFPPLLSALAAAFFAPRAEDDRSSPPLELLATFILGWVFPASAMALSLSGPWCLAVAKGVFEEGGSRRGRGGSRGSGRSRSRSRSRAARTTANGSPSRGATRSPPPTTAGEETAAASSSSSSAEAEALELYRGTLFGALWAQAGLSRLAPLPGSLAFAGPLVSTLLTWLLYGLMAFDYRFTAESERLRGGRARSAAAAAAAVGVADRFAAFGRAWPFYLAFGLVAASPSLVLPFWEVRETFFLLF